jgi:predicted nucleic acid-binding protein
MESMTRVYVETSALGFYFDDRAPRERDAVRALFGRFLTRELEGMTSEATSDEVRVATPDLARRLLGVLESTGIEVVPVTPEVTALATDYVDAGLVPRSHPVDAVHIAVSVLHRVDIVASYNLKHLASPKVVAQVNSFNKARSLPGIDIRTPERIP